MTDGSSDEPGRPTPVQTVYDQYWEHIRHVEDEMWSFTRIWAVVITAIFGILGTELPVAARVGTAGFGIVLCVLGFFTVYTLRVPFFNYFLTLELIARRDFGLEEPYRRFRDEPSSDLNKGIDLHDILIGVYSLTAGVLAATIGIVLGETLPGFVAGVSVTTSLLIVYKTYIVPKFEQATEEVAREIWIE